MEWDGWRWFNVSAPWLRFRDQRVRVRPWNLFHRDSTDGRFWGFGVLQVNRRHLFFWGSSGLWVAFREVRVWNLAREG
jgi:hypothetical protein